MTNFPMLYSSRPSSDRTFIQKVCNDILSHTEVEKPHSDKYCFIYIEGRDREINCLEDVAAFKSTKVFSEYNYPIFLFCKNTSNLLGDPSLLKKWRINIIPVEGIDSHQKYSDYCIKEMFYKIPYEIENIVTFQPDGMFINSGWEEWLEKENIDLIGSHWRHLAAIQVKDKDNWLSVSYNSVYGCNMGFSFRKASKIREISRFFGQYTQREAGAPNDKVPPEDLFYSFWGYGSKICKMPTLNQCDKWAIDPMDEDLYKEKTSFGFHFLKAKSEWPRCNHS